MKSIAFRTVLFLALINGIAVSQKVPCTEVSVIDSVILKLLLPINKNPGPFMISVKGVPLYKVVIQGSEIVANQCGFKLRYPTTISGIQFSIQLPDYAHYEPIEQDRHAESQAGRCIGVFIVEFRPVWLLRVSSDPNNVIIESSEFEGMPKHTNFTAFIRNPENLMVTVHDPIFGFNYLQPFTQNDTLLHQDHNDVVNRICDAMDPRPQPNYKMFIRKNATIHNMTFQLVKP